MSRILVCLAIGLAGVAQADDRADIAAVVEKYGMYQESGDLVAQSRLMMDDRVGLWDGILRSRPALEELQQQMRKTQAFNAHYPGLGLRVVITGLDIRLWGDTAVATFQMHTSRVLPAGLPAADRDKLSIPVPVKLFVHTLTKHGGAWRIAATAMQFAAPAARVANVPRTVDSPSRDALVALQHKSAPSL